MKYLKILFKVIILLALIGPVVEPVFADNYWVIDRNRLQVGTSQRVALVIGNGGYPSQTDNLMFGPLKNPLNDADDMKQVLEAYGFQVLLVKEGRLQDMEEAVEDFIALLRNDSVGIFYFSGHGVQVDGINYLIPVGRPFRNVQQVKYNALKANEVLDRMADAGTQVTLMILDACREQLQGQSKGISQPGLADMTASGSIVAYAAAPGKTASDGTGRNGIYTQFLLKAIQNGGHLSLYEVFQHTGAAVQKATQNAQNPWLASSFYGQFCFGTCGQKSSWQPELSKRLRTCEKFFQANQLTTGRNGTALACYEQVLQQDATNAEALAGLAKIEAKYVRWIEGFLAKGQHRKAEQYLDRLRHVNPQSPQLAELTERMQPNTEIVSTTPVSPLPFVDDRTFRAGKVFRDRLADGSYGPEMVWIPAGAFWMGDLQGNGYQNEKPVHWVSLDRFALGKYEITFAEYDKFAEATGRHKPSDEGWGRGTRPVINVSWHDATAYAEWLTEQTGHPYRLPTEAEWEYAARAGSQTEYGWGDKMGSHQANCWDYYGDRFKYTAPVNAFATNAFGLHNMVGNVLEWVADPWHPNYQGAPKDGRVWEQANQNKRLLRGGSWSCLPADCRVAYRYWYPSVNRYFDVGFRVVTVVESF